ncbi:MAG TPA: amino acid adenylation domain-containing protein, partial [Thermoanaerobaculia bacterium]|nr:amino acid adenylation domain-containing protein [Thermoanaerobaculia bacterium]
EMELLGFNTLQQRRSAFSGRWALWSEGTLRALMEAHGGSADEARRLMEAAEERDLSVGQFYGELQSVLGERVLVDKTPSYALDGRILERMEESFEEPLYVHLLRHPCGMIGSFLEAKLAEVFFRPRHEFTDRELSELIWRTSHENILAFLERIPSARSCQVRFEELVRSPRESLERLCGLIGVDFEPAMLEPYEGSSRRMTDGIHELSKMVGDVKFHQHRAIDPGVAERWREKYRESSLGEGTRQLARVLGYGAGERWRRIERSDWQPGTPLPLSFAQERLWFLDRLDPGSSVYNVPTAVRLTGALDVEALGRAVEEIVRRHASLRTTFAVCAGRPAQVVAPRLGLARPLVELAALPAAWQEAEVRRLVREETARPFDLARGPLLRAVLLRLSEREHVAVFTLHHIVSDAWSMGVLVREVAAHYGAFLAGRPSLLPELPIQYADFTLWQREWLQGEALEGQLAYWRERLAGAPPVLELPLDRPRLAVHSFRGGRLRHTLPGSVNDAVGALAGERGTTRFIALLTAFAAALCQHTGQPDLVVGTAVANRNRPEIEGLIGFFVNTLALRADVAGDPSFLELLERLRASALGAYAHQDLPFEKLVEELAPERTLQHTPLFQVMFLVGEPAAALALPGLSLSPLAAGNHNAKFDLAVTVGESPAGLEVSVGYNRNLFYPATVSRLVHHFGSLLAGAMQEPERRLSELPWLSPSERHQLRSEWSGRGRSAGGLAPIPVLIEARAGAEPGSIAVSYEGRRLSYGELSRRSNALASRLRRLGVEGEDRVGLLLDRSPELAVAILGIWKSGGAYVPLDPGLPPERLRFMVADSVLSSPRPVLVTASSQQALVASLGLSGARVVLLDGPLESLEEPAVEPAAALDPSQLAYLIYTSGTTGLPKAVQVDHGSLSETLSTALTSFGFGPGDRMPCLSSSSFDIFLFELFAPLLGGGESVLFRLQPTVDLGELLSSLPAMTLLHAVPSLMREVVVAARRRSKSGVDVGSRLRQVFVGGEAVGPELLAGLAEVFPSARLTVLYGPTEGTVIASSLDVGEEDRAGQRIGQPLPGALLELRDAAGERVPIGVPGEVWLGGRRVTRGYLGRPELTAERYVPGAGGRWYRTGDLGRLLFDGGVEFLGRLDRQVKVRGFRVELGELESALSGLAGVRTAAVVAASPPGGAGEVRLVACVVAEDGAAASPEELAASLRSVLPEPMVPSGWLLLPSLPLTPHGKVDRRALERLAQDRPEDGGERRAVGPRTPLELWLSELWCEVLGVESVGAEENFFALGGNSIKVAILTNLLQERLGEQVWVVALFDAPTIGRLARYLEERYPAAVGRVTGVAARGEEAPEGLLDEASLERFRGLIEPLAPWPVERAGRNRRAVFILSPPRSGSTLLRVMLGG